MGTPGAADERRKYPRLGTEQIVSYAEVDRPDCFAVGKDLSMGGIRFETIGCEINLGDTLRVTFNLGTHTVVAVGTVAWATETDAFRTDVGIEFLEIDPRAIEILETFESEEV